MRNRTVSPVKASRRPRIALGVALAMLAGGLWSAWSCAQGTAPVAPAAPAAVTTPAATNATNATATTAATALPPAPQMPAKVSGAARQPVKRVERSDMRLAWTSLTPSQRTALEPLALEWPKMTEPHKEKWLVICKKFAQMKPEEQQRLHDRMRDWVKLTPAQRNAARTNYARAKKLDAEEKNEQWNKYQQLTAEQKKKLAQAKLPKRVAKLPTAPSSAAPAIQLPAEALERPVPPPVMPVTSPGAQAVTPPAAAPANLSVAGALGPVSPALSDAAK